MKDKFAQWNVLFMEYLKCDWKIIVFWVFGLGAFVGGFVPAFVEISKGQGLVGMYETMKNPAMISMVGVSPIKDAADYTVGAMYSHTMLLFSGLIAMLISAIHVVNHTRKEEEKGLTEFVCSYCVGRYAGSFALMLEEILIHVSLAVFIGGLMAVFDVKSIETGPAFLFGASVGMAGFIGAVIALVMSQIMATSTGATGSVLGIIGLLYVLRGDTDITNVDWSMFNPMGWTYLTFPFTENHVLPLLYAAIFCAVMVFFAFALLNARDMGAGYLPETKGSRKAKKSLLSVHGLFLRLNRGVMIGWILTFFVLGAAYGSIYGDMQTFLEANDLIKMMFTLEGVSMEASFTSVILVVLMGLTSILPVVVVNKLFAEESDGHLAQLYATKTSRVRVYWTTAILAAIAGTLAILAGALGLGGAAIVSMGESKMELIDFIKAGMNYFPAILFITAVAALVLGWIPGYGKLLYVYIGYSLMLNYFHNILDLPEWFEKTAILSWIPRMPADAFEKEPLLTIIGISAVLLVLGYIGYQRRDLIEKI